MNTRLLKHIGQIRVVITSALVVFTATPVQALDDIVFYPLQAEATIRFDGTDQRSNTSPRYRDIEWRAGVRLTQKGYVLDPEIAQFLLDIEPVYIGGKIDSNGSKDDREGDFLSYLAQLSLLRGTPGPFSFDFSTMRSANVNNAALGSRYDDEIELHTASVRWKNRAFPMQFDYTQRSLDQEFTSSQSSFVSRRDELLKTWTVKGRSSKMDLLLERQIMDDRVVARNQDYELDRLLFNHRFPWGKNSQLDSRWNYLDRTGFNANKRLTLVESAYIQHTDAVFSRSIYSYNLVEQLSKTEEHTIESTLSHRLYSNLTTSARVLDSKLDSDNFDQTRWRTELEALYQKQELLFGGDFQASVAVSYQETDRNSNSGLADVVDESHVVPIGGMIILDQRFIVTSTIIVTNADGTLNFTEGIDYLVFDLPEDLSQVQTIPGGRISVGDTVLVSYKAQVLPSQKFSTVFNRYRLGVNFGWLNFSHSSRVSDDSLLSGAGESFLNDYKDIVTNIEFRWRVAGVDTVLGGERRYNETNTFTTETYTLRQYFSWSPTSNTVWNVNATEAFTETDFLSTDLYTVELSTRWQPVGSLLVRPMIGAWKRRDEGAALPDGKRDDSYITAGFSLRWFYRKVSLDLAYHYNSRATDGREIDENRLMFNLRRRL